MRDDLLESQASIQWAIAYIPTLQDRFARWQQTQPYRVVREPDPKGSDQFLVAYPGKPLDPLIYADIGAIINSIRSALDLLAAVLSKRNGIEPDTATHFPIHRLRANFLNDLRGIKKKKALSKTEIARIKSLRPYARGDKTLYPLHRLDIMRKHHRFLNVDPIVAGANITAWGPGIVPYRLRLNDKTILYRLPRSSRFNPHQGNTMMAAEIFVNEPTLGLNNELAVPLLRRYAARVLEIIKLFDTL
jgi:hypothetical protein